MNRIVVGLALVLAANGPDAGKIDRLIRQLGSDQFVEREAASKQLAAIGEPVLPALETATRSEDAEVRQRARELVRVIRASRETAVAATLLKLGGQVHYEQGEVVSVDLSGTKVRDQDLARLKQFKHLSALDLSGTSVTDEGLAHLSGLRELRVLSLSGTLVTGKGLGHLAGMKGLWRLELSRTPLTDPGLTHLKRFAALESLLLYGTRVTDEGVADLKKAFRKLKVDR